MDTQPKKCFCLNLRTGTLTLAICGIVGNLAGLTLFCLFQVPGLLPGIQYSEAACFAVFTLLNLWFLVGAAERNYKVINYFASYIILHMVFMTVEETLRLLNALTRNDTCANSTSFLCRVSPAAMCAYSIVCLLGYHFLHICFFFSIKAYSVECKKPQGTWKVLA
ncbi:hypothetical protein DSO57_1000947 [Entomophthora muscae]|uniref:Uncharacterized protein n=2 Tax=Entomophthora muscae TaxID=34485 RepID=A0ACC2STU2_9FUNG|nr:hypothetical protein DSO57_1016930 [Entomophthora muscae]KAJ9075007.1 hypothetical protein DSO57_1000947 [Entomophthora muscae]